jgi:hypothetical protein
MSTQDAQPVLPDNDNLIGSAMGGYLRRSCSGGDVSKAVRPCAIHR